MTEREGRKKKAPDYMDKEREDDSLKSLSDYPPDFMGICDLTKGRG
jgi:hypothetical protein